MNLYLSRDLIKLIDDYKPKPIVSYNYVAHNGKVIVYNENNCECLLYRTTMCNSCDRKHKNDYQDGIAMYDLNIVDADNELLLDNKGDLYRLEYIPKFLANISTLAKNVRQIINTVTSCFLLLIDGTVMLSPLNNINFKPLIIHVDAGEIIQISHDNIWNLVALDINNNIFRTDDKIKHTDPLIEKYEFKAVMLLTLNESLAYVSLDGKYYIREMEHDLPFIPIKIFRYDTYLTDDGKVYFNHNNELTLVSGNYYISNFSAKLIVVDKKYVCKWDIKRRTIKYELDIEFLFELPQ